MSTNDFLPFATGGGANVLSQSDYAALGALVSGFSAGVAKSQHLNKVWRQASIIAAVVAQFIVDRSGQDALDDGTTATLLANLKASAAAVTGDATKNFNVAAASLSNHAVNQGQVFGVGQTLQNVTGSRALGTNYTNSTGKPIVVFANGTAATAGAALGFFVGGVEGCISVATGAGGQIGVMGIVLPGGTYTVAQTGGATLSQWYEIR